ncbi:hypothetical protein [Azospirillum sp.]|uniref:hypothetical protein n=1 Tax=Azospirillum sp. TaxID=34012 RepID=UPI003D744A2D
MTSRIALLLALGVGLAACQAPTVDNPQSGSSAGTYSGPGVQGPPGASGPPGQKPVQGSGGGGSSGGAGG